MLIFGHTLLYALSLLTQFCSGVLYHHLEQAYDREDNFENMSDLGELFSKKVAYNLDIKRSRSTLDTIETEF